MQDAPSAKSRVSFNPHPPVGAGATPQKVGLRTCVDGVSILTRPWGRVQPVSLLGMPCDRLFQSSPARGGGCNSIERAALETDTVVSILTRPWGRVQRHLPVAVDNRVLVSILTRPWGRVQPSEPVSRKTTYASFQSSPARGGGCNLDLLEPRFFVLDVSILTRPWGRVQRGGVRLVGDAPDEVSILTRPWGRVQPAMLVLPDVSGSMFQSSPARGGGCNATPKPLSRLKVATFQSSPARGGGCNVRAASALSASGAFQSSPARGGGSNSVEFSVANNLVMFQSSPARGGGCNAEGNTASISSSTFQSSPARGGGCNLARRCTEYQPS